jgi:uncharacterized protein Smg (DUF494 family)
VTGPADRDPAQRLLALVARHLQAFLEGDELALAALPDAIEEAGFDGDDVESAVLALRAMAGDGPGAAVVASDQAPGSSSHRVPSAEERHSMSPEAWGYLLDLRRNGALDAEQFERVLERLAATGIRPIGLDLALAVAAHVALRGAEPLPFISHGEGEITH